MGKIKTNDSLTPGVLTILMNWHNNKIGNHLMRYIRRVRYVNGGGSKESWSKNWIARFKRAYLKFVVVFKKKFIVLIKNHVIQYK